LHVPFAKVVSIQVCFGAKFHNHEFIEKLRWKQCYEMMNFQRPAGQIVTIHIHPPSLNSQPPGESLKSSERADKQDKANFEEIKNSM
jgi:hypothetical protein